MALSEQKGPCDGVVEDAGGFAALLGKPILLLLAGLTGNFYLVFGLLLGFGALSFLVMCFAFTKRRKKRGRR